MNRIEDLARHYLELVRGVQGAGEGPYLLAGSSFGGVVSFEMAQQLHDQGQQTALLALFDSPDLEALAREMVDEVVILTGMLREGVDMPIPTLMDTLRSLDAKSRFRYALEQGRRAKTFPDHFELADLHQLVHLMDCHFQALRSYRPRVFAGEMVYFRAAERDALNPPHPEKSWIPLAPAGVSIHEVPGGHESMSFPPHVPSLAARLNRYLARVG
jgi:thioesterase domain-containing protein